jgi:hypothetical protein
VPRSQESKPADHTVFGVTAGPPPAFTFASPLTRPGRGEGEGGRENPPVEPEPSPHPICTHISYRRRSNPLLWLVASTPVIPLVSHKLLAGGFGACLDPFARSARPSIRVIISLDRHQLLFTSSDAEAVRTKRSNLLLDTLAGRQALTRSPLRPGTLVFHLRTIYRTHFRVLSLSLDFTSRGSTQLTRPALGLGLLLRFIHLRPSRHLSFF